MSRNPSGVCPLNGLAGTDEAGQKLEQSKSKNERVRTMEKYSNVNFEYPTCGGVEVKKGRKYWQVTVLSNYTGSYTNRVHRLPITGTEAAEDVYVFFCNHPGSFELVKKGFIVQ